MMFGKVKCSIHLQKNYHPTVNPDFFIEKSPNLIALENDSGTQNLTGFKWNLLMVTRFWIGTLKCDFG